MKSEVHAAVEEEVCSKQCFTTSLVDTIGQWIVVICIYLEAPGIYTIRLSAAGLSACTKSFVASLVSKLSIMVIEK